MTTGLDRQKMVYAAWTMARTKKIKTTSRLYAKLKEEATAQLVALQKGVKRGPQSPEHRQKLSEASKRRYQDPEQRRLSSERSRGKKHSEESKAKMRKPKTVTKQTVRLGMTGKTHSPETLEKMRAAWVRRKANMT